MFKVCVPQQIYTGKNLSQSHNKKQKTDKNKFRRAVISEGTRKETVGEDIGLTSGYC